MPKHVHRYHKVRVNEVEVWGCSLPDCNHHMPKHYEHFITGKYSVCWNCGRKDMKMGPEQLIMAMPQCHECLHPELIEKVKTEVYEGTRTTMDEYIAQRLARGKKDETQH